MIEFKKYIHHGVELEEAILGACMIDKSAFGRTHGILTQEMFYKQGHQEVYKAISEMYDNSVPIDILTVTEWMIKNEVEILGGDNLPYFVSRLTNSVVSSAHIEYHSHLIKEMWQRREVLKLKYSALDDNDPKKNMEDINKRINEILGGTQKNDWYDMSQLMYDLLIHQSDMASGKKTFITTGFKKADQLNGGFYNGQLIIIGARPSVGKSALMGKMALDIAKSGKSIGIISLEMNNTEIAGRLASIETDIDFGTIYRSIANDEKLHKRFYEQITKQTINLPIYLSDKTKVNVNEIKSKAYKLKSKGKLDCLMVDYLQLIDGTAENKNYNREQEVSKMSRGLKLLAQELDVPVVVLCQLNRQVTSRSYADRFPKLSDLRESGAIEQDADVVMFIHRDYMSGFQQDEAGNTTEYTADLVVPKWRNGATFHLPLEFEPTKMRFTEKREMVCFTPVKNFYEKEDNPF